MDSFCEICWSPDLLDIVCKHFRFSGGPAQTDDACSERCSEEMLLRVMEETIYQQAIEHERRAKKAESLYISGDGSPPIFWISPENGPLMLLSRPYFQKFRRRNRTYP